MRPRFLGIPLDPWTLPQTLERCAAWIEAGRPAQHVSLNAAKVLLVLDDPQLRAIVEAAELISADGQGVVWAARWLGLAVPERVAGIDLMEQLLALAERRAWPVYFLGARPETLRRFLDEVRRRHPRLPIAGSRDGYFDDDRAVAG